jgi:hypothetical protein
MLGFSTVYAFPDLMVQGVFVDMMPLTDPLHSPQMIHEWMWCSSVMIREGKPKSWEQRMSQWHCAHKSHLVWPGCERGSRLEAVGDKPLGLQHEPCSRFKVLLSGPGTNNFLKDLNKIQRFSLKLIFALFKKPPPHRLYIEDRFITASTRARHLSLSSARWVQSTSLRANSVLRSKWWFPSVFPD